MIGDGFDDLLRNIQALKQQTAQKRKEAEQHWAEQIQTRVLNVLAAYAKYPQLYNLIPQFIRAGTVIGNREKEDNKCILLFLQKAERKLVRVPDTGKDSETKPNFTNVTDAESTDWLDALTVVSNLSDVLPRDIRDEVGRD